MTFALRFLPLSVCPTNWLRFHPVVMQIVIFLIKSSSLNHCIDAFYLEIFLLTASLLPSGLQLHISCKRAAPLPAISRLWARYWLISVMSALGCRKEEVTSNLPLCFPQLQIHLLGCQLKPLEQLLHHMGEASESEETGLPFEDVH